MRTFYSYSFLANAITVALAAPNCRSAARLPDSIEGPITGGSRGHPFSAFVGNISDIGYIEEEYFFSGTAERYDIPGGYSLDGKWTLIPNGTAQYKTRILVRRPANDDDFNGDVILEWNNVSGGYDLMLSDAPGVYEAGYVFVGVSAQVIGLIGYENLAGHVPIGLTKWDPERYGTLVVPDDRYAYDIFTQAANLLKSGKVPHVKAENVIGTGESQSGIHLVAYSNGVQPLYNAFDALLPVIAFGQASNFSGTITQIDPTTMAPAVPARIRTDLKVPVHEINTETEALDVFIQGCRQPQTDKYRYWEITGAAHANVLILNKTAAVTQRDDVPGAPTANFPNLDEASWLPPLDTAYQHASRWIRTGTPPPIFPLMDIAPSTSNPLGVDYVRDGLGNTKEGARLPEISVPIAAHNGSFGLGTSIPFNSTILKSLYPTHTDYVTKVSLAAVKAQQDGLILGYRVNEYIRDAKAANIPPQ